MADVTEKLADIIQDTECAIEANEVLVRHFWPRAQSYGAEKLESFRYAYNQWRQATDQLARLRRELEVFEALAARLADARPEDPS